MGITNLGKLNSRIELTVKGCLCRITVNKGEKEIVIAFDEAQLGHQKCDAATSSGSTSPTGSSSGPAGSTDDDEKSPETDGTKPENGIPQINTEFERSGSLVFSDD